MRDIHCHILPGVDDGARDINESLAMLEAARKAGVTSMVCTPHCRDPYFDYETMQAAFLAFKDAARGFNVSMGFEVAHRKLMRLGLETWAPYLAFEQTGEFLLELDFGCEKGDFVDYERSIFKLQGMGLKVIIAHPERYRAIQKDPTLAEELVRMGCKLQVSADYIGQKRLSKTRRTAERLIKDGLITYVASDAHRPEHYPLLKKALES